MPKLTNGGTGIEWLPSGRCRIKATIDGRREKSPTMDYEWQALAWRDIMQNPDIDDPFGYRAAWAARHNPTPAAAPVLTVGEWATDWLGRRRAEVGDDTWKWYRTQSALLVEVQVPDLDGGTRRFGDTPLDGKERADIDDWIAAMKDAGTGKPTMNGRLKVLRMMYQDAVANRKRSGGIVVDPTSGIKRQTLDIVPGRILSLDEQTAALDAATSWTEKVGATTQHRSDPDLRRMILLGLDAGLRWSEVAGIGADCFAPGRVIVRQTVNRRRELRPDTKNHKPRSVPLTDRLAAELGPAIRDARKRGERALLFVDAAGGPVDYFNTKNCRFIPALRRAGLVAPTGEEPLPWAPPEPTFHDLRRTWISWLRDEGVPDALVKMWAGHGDLRVTDGYTLEVTGGQGHAQFSEAQKRRDAQLTGRNVIPLAR